MNYEHKIPELSQRLAVSETRLGELAEQRVEFALHAVEGNQDAINSLHELDKTGAALGRERDDLRAAIEQAGRLWKAEAAAVEEQDREHRQVQARKLADEILQLNAEIDAAMNELHTMFERRSSLIQQFGRLKTLDSSVVLRMAQKLGPTAAARAAGLSTFIGIDHVPPTLIAPLVSSSKILRANKSGDNDERETRQA